MFGSSRRQQRYKSGARKLRPTSLEALETRQLLAADPLAGGNPYAIGVYPPRTVSHYSPALDLALPVGSRTKDLLQLDNEGKRLSGKDREGDEWFLTLHGPGSLIVTDATPNDGVFDDDLDTIRIVGANPHKTYVTGQTAASARVITDGTVSFNRLISENGVQSIILNGFNLTNTTGPQYAGQPNNVGPEIYLPGGVRTLQFNAVEAVIDLNTNDQPFEIVIGSPDRRLRQTPRIKVGSIFNTVVDSAFDTIPNGQVQTTPTVNVLINGGVARFEAVSATRSPIRDSGLAFKQPTVSTTGRTALRANSAGLVKLYGAARNFVISRAGAPMQPQTGEPGIPTPLAPTTVPFTPFSGLSKLWRVEIGGPTDAIGIDVDGAIGGLKFNRGIGDPTGVMPGATNLGYSEADRGYASFGLLGGLVVADSIGSMQVGPNNLILQTPQDPDFMQLDRKGSTKFYARPGNALTSTAIVTEGSIGDVHIVGNSQNSQISAGFDYDSYIAGLDPLRAPSVIRSFFQRGSLIDSVVTASYSPGPDGIYGDATPAGSGTDSTDDQIGPGGITGGLEGARFFAGGTTALGYFGAGFYARHKNGFLPPEDAGTRNDSITFRP